MATIGVILSGCGVYDGAEIQEAVLTLLALERGGVRTLAYAPNIEQHHVINHITGQEMPGQTRNVMVEAARIVRGAIHDLADFDAASVDALILPGGFGAAKNLSNLAFAGERATVHPSVAAAMQAVYAAGKPIGAICITPAVLALALKGKGIDLTIGDEKETADVIVSTGNRHIEKDETQIVIDKAHNIVSTPAYMCAANIATVAQGIEALVEEVVRRVHA
ncbi:MAG: isoprenoid biosynthesis protein ElbB [Alphaproteobacteria bacterium CG_4_10_14_0_2_um_filter_63_37]|nr:MAG: isoprenoid biosynthesis protein ElbB [Proteobacteria bacterium CG1_02_64_396]PJA25102.1 MAG: isoprenoid biosynthesis protein ElbB [Alphaproteobacteria bacterium CG_4_10_14_0_2_um_filter_63_37]